MEMNFREYAETFWGPGLGAAAGWAVGGLPLAAVGGYLGHKAEKWYQNLMDPSQREQPKVNPNYFVYYRDIDGRIQKELLPNEYDKQNTPQSDEYKNADQNHPYFYYWDERKNKIVKKIKAGYQAYQRRGRYGAGYGQQQGYGQQGGRGRQRQRRGNYGY